MVFVFCGKKRSGKNTASKAFREVAEALTYEVREFAFADELRKHLEILNPNLGMDRDCTWNEAIKDFGGYEQAKAAIPEMRRLMQVYGTEVIRDRVKKNWWAEYTRREIEQWFDCAGSLHPAGRIALVTDGRFETEGAEMMLVKNTNSTFIRVDRPGLESSDNHSSEDISWLNDEDPAFRRIIHLVNDMPLHLFELKTKKIAHEAIAFGASKTGSYRIGFNRSSEWGILGLHQFRSNLESERFQSDQGLQHQG